MATVKVSIRRSPQAAADSSKPIKGDRPLHRVKLVRRRQGVSLRSAARQLGTDVRQTRLLEDESTDLRLSDLYRWQQALDVPIGELLVESESPLSRPVMERARMIRLMKTTMAIYERCESQSIRRMAETMVEQLVEIMPELASVSPWHAVGQRRSLEDFGRVVERRVSDDVFHSPLSSADD